MDARAITSARPRVCSNNNWLGIFIEGHRERFAGSLSLESAMHGTQELNVVERFKERNSSTPFHCSEVQRLVIPRCYDDDAQSWQELVHNSLNPSLASPSNERSRMTNGTTCSLA